LRTVQQSNTHPKKGRDVSGRSTVPSNRGRICDRPNVGELLDVLHRSGLGHGEVRDVGARDVDVGESEAEERDGGAQVASVLGAMGLDYVDLARCL
jgi:hypothetical protein